jgi:hypothetical protein
MPKCRVSDCTVKRAIFNNAGETKGICCSKHKEEGMIDIFNKNLQCKFDDCSTRATYNFKDELNAMYCKKHSENGMVDILNKNKQCKFDNCSIRAIYNFKDEQNAIYCKSHKKNGMINIIDKSCLSDGCKVQPNFNYENEKLPIYCSKHKLENMIDIKNKTCKNSWCKTRSIPKYKDYCLRCFIHEFPDQKISRHYKIKETHVTDYLKETFPDKFTFDKTVGGCSKRRPDAYLDLYTHIIIVECDENQHTDYDTTCEITRLNELFTDLGDRPLVFIRFNPDAYNNKPSSFKYHKTSGVPIIRNIDEWTGRLESLKKCINKHIYDIPKETKFEYLFYK